MRELWFRSAVVRVHADHIESRFYGGAASRFYPPIGKPEFVEHARFAGYVDPMQFGLEHDIMHHVVSTCLGWERSPVVWWSARGCPDEPETQERRDYEEHMVVRLQRYINTGKLDEDYGLLEASFPCGLPYVVRQAIVSARPWLVC